MATSYKVLIFAFLCLFQWTTSDSERSLVLTFRPEESKFPRVKILTAFSDMREFTICYWYRLMGISANSNVVLHYHLYNQCVNTTYNELFIQLDNNSTCISSSTISSDCISFTTWNHCDSSLNPLLKWQHFCFVWSSYSGMLLFYKDTKLVGYKTNFKTRHNILGGGELLISYDKPRYYPKNVTNLHNAFGEITEMNIWNQILCPVQIKKLASCNSDLEGNIMSWRQATMVMMDNVEIRRGFDVCTQC